MRQRKTRGSEAFSWSFRFTQGAKIKDSFYDEMAAYALKKCSSVLRDEHSFCKQQPIVINLRPVYLSVLK